MKKTFIAVALIFAGFVFSGCNGNDKSARKDAAIENTVETEVAAVEDSNNFQDEAVTEDKVEKPFVGMLKALGAEKWMVFGDSLKVRNGAGLDSQKVDTLVFGDVVTVYEVVGSGEYVDGVYDSWCRISGNGEDERWVNSMYIAQFPIQIDTVNSQDVTIFPYDPHNENCDGKLVIKGILEEEGKRKFNLSFNGVELKRDVAPVVTNLGDDIFKGILDNYIELFYWTRERTVKYGNEDDSALYDAETGEYVGGTGMLYYKYPDSRLEYDIEKKVVRYYPSSDRNLHGEIEAKINRIEIQDNASIRKNVFVKWMFSNYKVLPESMRYGSTYTAENSKGNVVLLYGLCLGMDIKDVIDILGEPDSVEGSSYYFIKQSQKDDFDFFVDVEDGKVCGMTFFMGK